MDSIPESNETPDAASAASSEGGLNMGLVVLIVIVVAAVAVGGIMTMIRRCRED